MTIWRRFPTLQFPTPARSALAVPRLFSAGSEISIPIFSGIWPHRGSFQFRRYSAPKAATCENIFPDADYLFCAEPGTQLISDRLPCAPLLQPLLDDARSRTEFVQVGKWTFMKSTHSLYLFQRVDFHGYEPIAGLGEIEGPYPQFRHTFVCWGSGPATKLRVPVDRDGVYEVYWHVKTGFQNQIVTVKLDGKSIGTQKVKFSQKNEFGENRFPIAMKAGDRELEFDYPFWDTNDPHHRAVLFHHLNISRRE
jgi:hypothetical protein